ncbi:MAG TPA: DinB family protein [Blastocatellia bacterium]|nr:DinB family protein [Blastocatellia bacterium]
MERHIAWFDYKFSFDLPLWMYPNVVERLRGTPARLEDRLAALPHDLLIRREGERWSMQENAGHLLDLESLWLGRLDDFVAGLPRLRPADLQNRHTHEANHNARSITEILAAFRAARGELVRRLETLDEALAGRTALHPRLQQPMRVLDSIFFVAEHDDHHLARITELLHLFPNHRHI